MGRGTLSAFGLGLLLLGGIASTASAQTPKQVQNSEMKLRESRVMTEAWVYLELANADYKGRRAKAMKELEAAVRGLNGQIAKNGTAQQKAVATADNIAAIKVRFLREHAPGVIEPQALSNLYVKQAGVILLQLRPHVVQLNQPHLLKRLDTALKHIDAALKGL